MAARDEQHLRRARRQWGRAVFGLGLLATSLVVGFAPHLTMTAVVGVLPVRAQVLVQSVGGPTPPYFATAKASAVPETRRASQAMLAIESLRLSGFARVTNDPRYRFFADAQASLAQPLEGWEELLTHTSGNDLQTVYFDVLRINRGALIDQLPAEVLAVAQSSIGFPLYPGQTNVTVATVVEKVALAITKSESGVGVDAPTVAHALILGEKGGEAVNTRLREVVDLDTPSIAASIADVIEAYRDLRGRPGQHRGLRVAMPSILLAIRRFDRDTSGATGRLIDDLIELGVTEGLPELLSEMIRDADRPRLIEIDKMLWGSNLESVTNKSPFLPVMHAAFDRMDEDDVAENASRIVLNWVDNWPEATNLVESGLESPSVGTRYLCVGLFTRAAWGDSMRLRTVLEKVAANDASPQVRRRACDSLLMLKQSRDPGVLPVWHQPPCP